jgi:hypothetical protein
MAAVSEVKICNLALGWLGANLITAFDDQSTEAELCKNNYPTLRRAELEAHEWTFAQSRLILAPMASPPPWGYQAQFQKPADCLKVNYFGRSANVQEDDSFDPWVVEGNAILTGDAATVGYLRFTVDVQDVAKFSEGFAHSLAARLAMDLAMPLTQNGSLAGAMSKLYAAKVGIAIAADQRQGRTPITRATGMLAARRSGTAFIGPTV